MKPVLIFCASILFITSACNKKSSDNGTIVEYQVTSTNSSGLDISYNNVLENKIDVNGQNSWVMDIQVSQKPFHAYLQGSSNSPFSSVTTTCTVNILVNGAVVKTATASSTTVATALAEFTVQ